MNSIIQEGKGYRLQNYLKGQVAQECQIGVIKVWVKVLNYCKRKNNSRLILKLQTSTTFLIKISEVLKDCFQLEILEPVQNTTEMNKEAR